MNRASTSGEHGLLPANISIGRVRLRIADLDRAREFYVQRLGLQSFESSPEAAAFGPAGGHAIVRVHRVHGTRKRPESTPGLYHFAILFPDRASLAHVVAHLRESHWPFHGFADHGVSEAAYLADPDGNGVELYVDRPRDEWPRSNGGIAMYSQPLDLPSLLGEAGASTQPGAPAATRIGHMHLHVSDLVRAERFWAGNIGFTVTTRDYPGALFLAAGGYHHHIGLNTWARNRTRPSDVAGLLDFSIHTGSTADRDAVRSRLDEQGIAYTETEEGLALEDPEGNGVVITA
ncbi:MAG: VOC family protein [Longimicrobiales bacterium]